MNKKELILPITVIGLTLLFAGVCFALFLSKGKSEKWLKRKMKLGAILLTLTAASCNGGSGDEVEMCYVEVMADDIELDVAYETAIKLSLDTTNYLPGRIYNKQGQYFSFLLLDKEQNKVLSDEFTPLNDSAGKSFERFVIKLDKELDTGKYELQLFTTSVEKQDSFPFQRNFELIIE